MPNQLAASKRRTTIAEHSAVLDALEEIARIEGSSIADILRAAARSTVRAYAAESATTDKLRSIILKHEPKPPEAFKSAAHVARYKRELRNYDALLQELNISSPREIQQRNSVSKSRPVLVSGF